jgi:pilus assembly protein Flp/PilA
MRKLTKAVWTFLVAEDGPTAVEYAIMLALVLVTCIVAVATLGSQTNSLFLKAASSIH